MLTLPIDLDFSLDKMKWYQVENVLIYGVPYGNAIYTFGMIERTKFGNWRYTIHIPNAQRSIYVGIEPTREYARIAVIKMFKTEIEKAQPQ